MAHQHGVSARISVLFDWCAKQTQEKFHQVKTAGEAIGHGGGISLRIFAQFESIVSYVEDHFKFAQHCVDPP